MQRKNTKLDFSGQEIYLGVDVGKKDWKVCILTKDFFHKVFSQPPDPKVLVGHLRKNFPGARYLCAYEAGCFGFWIYYALKEMGVDCSVVHPADVPTMDKERRNRNDKVDARKLARNVRNGDLNPVYVPTCTYTEGSGRSVIGSDASDYGEEADQMQEPDQVTP